MRLRGWSNKFNGLELWTNVLLTLGLKSFVAKQLSKLPLNVLRKSLCISMTLLWSARRISCP